MPEPPGWINEAKFITSFWFNDCHHPATLYITQSFPPTVGAARQLLALDLPQIARTLFRPGGNRTKRHGRKSDAKRRPPYTKVPDPNESAATVIKDVTNIGEREVADGPRALWTLLDLGESVIGKFFIVGLVEQWLYEYALFIDAGARSDCALPAVRGEGGGTRTGSGGTAFIGGCDAIWQNGGASCFDGTVFMPAARWLATCSGSIQNVGNNGDQGSITVTIGIQDGTGQWIHGGSTSHSLGYLEKADFTVATFFDNGEATGCFWVAHQDAGTFAHGQCSDIVIFCQAY